MPSPEPEDVMPDSMDGGTVISEAAQLDSIDPVNPIDIVDAMSIPVCSSHDPLSDARRTASTASHKESMPVYKFVLTGGPCAGKTTALARVSTFFKEKGFRVFTVPEAATSMFTNGLGLKDLGSPTKSFAFQWSILSLQIASEDAFERCARVCGQPSILLCDRGLMDGSVYMRKEEWARLAKSNGMDELTLRDGRYDGIFHLVTVACGAEEHYSLDNNEARTESVEMARDVDARTEGVWLGHPCHMLFDNSTGFDAKMDRIVSATSRIVGLPCRPRKLGKFLLTQPPPPLEEFPVRTEEFNSEKVFLLRCDPSEGRPDAGSVLNVGDGAVCVSTELFLEKRGRNGLFVYRRVAIFGYDDGTVAEVTTNLSAGEYERLERDTADPVRPTVFQRRVAFLWEGQAFELHTDVGPAHGISVLHRRSEGGELSLPTFLSVDD